MKFYGFFNYLSNIFIFINNFQNKKFNTKNRWSFFFQFDRELVKKSIDDMKSYKRKKSHKRLTNKHKNRYQKDFKR